MKKKIAAGAALALLAGGVAASPALAAPLQNGNFANGLANWTVKNEQVKLGVTDIGGCTSQDTTDYAAIRASTNPPLTTPTPDNDLATPLYSEYDTEISTTEVPAGSSHSLVMESDMFTANPFDVVHGPAVYSDEFSASPATLMSLKWRAEGGSDNFAILAYLLNVDTCTQTEILDATGDSTAWAEVSVPIPAKSNRYRFVFVSGTFDLTGGQAAGARLLISDIRSTQANPVAPPEAPPTTGAKTKTVGGKTVLSWQPPEFPGGGPVTGYLVQYRKKGKSGWKTLTSNTKSSKPQVAFSNSKLPSGKYSFRVAAINKNGPGEFAEILKNKQISGKTTNQVVTAKRSGKKAKLTGTTAQASTSVKIYRSAKRGAVAQLVGTTTSKNFQWKRSVPRGGTASPYFCMVADGKVSRGIKLSAPTASGAAVAGRPVGRGDVITCS